MRRLVLVVAACGGPTDPEPVVVELENVGHVCLYPSLPPPAPQSFDVGAPVSLRYRSVGPIPPTLCFSSSCTRDPEAMCSVVQNGADLEVTTLARWLDITRPDVPCTDDCGSVGAECSTPPLDAGDYRFTFGTQTLTLQVPSQHTTELCMDIAP